MSNVFVLSQHKSGDVGQRLCGRSPGWSERVMSACNIAASEMVRLESMIVDMQRMLANSDQDPTAERALANLRAAQDTLTRWRSLGHTSL